MYTVEKKAIEHKLYDVVLNGEKFFILRNDYIDRAKQIESLEDEETKQMKLQTLYLYLMAIGEKQYDLSDVDDEYQSELEM